MSNNDVKIDHEAAKKWAKRMLTPEGLTEEEINLARAYLDAMARLAEWEATARKLTNGLCSDREELEGFIEEMVDILKGELAPLEAQRDEATELLERAYWLVEHFETATYDTKSDWGRLVRAFLAKHRKTGAQP